MSKASTELNTQSRFDIDSSYLSTVYLNLSLILMIYCVSMLVTFTWRIWISRFLTGCFLILDEILMLHSNPFTSRDSRAESKNQ